MSIYQNFINKSVSEGLDDLLKAAEYAVQFGDENDRKPDKFFALGEKLLDCQRKMKLSELILQTGKEASSIEEFDEIVEKARTNNKVRLQGLTAFKDSIKDILVPQSSQGESSRTSLGGGDIIVTQSSFNSIDPITKRPIEIPVKNKICGHIYDKTSIFEAIKLNKRMRCPIMGCGNIQHVAKNQIIPVSEPTTAQQHFVDDDSISETTTEPHLVDRAHDESDDATVEDSNYNSDSGDNEWSDF